MFILNIEKCSFNNYPKYVVVVENIQNVEAVCFTNTFHYLVAKKNNFNGFLINSTFPNYMIILFLFFDVGEGKEKFKLNKLGTDYILNDICVHYRSECEGEYPDNYKFINMYNDFTSADLLNRVDRSPLKKSKLRPAKLICLSQV